MKSTMSKPNGTRLKTCARQSTTKVTLRRFWDATNHSWERGANENMNGLIRQFFPKKMTSDLNPTLHGSWTLRL